MVNVRAERSAGWSAICFVVVAAIAFSLAGPLPDLHATPAAIASYFDAHRAGLLWSAWLTLPAAGLYLWFLVGLTTYLTEAPGRQEGLAMLAFAAGVLIAAESFATAFLQSALAYGPTGTFVANSLQSLYIAFIFSMSGLGWAPVAIFFFAASHSMRRHRSAPSWLAYFGYFASFTASVASLSIFFHDPSLSPTGFGCALLGAVPAFIWLLGTGFVLVRTPVLPD